MRRLTLDYLKTESGSGLVLGATCGVFAALWVHAADADDVASVSAAASAATNAMRAPVRVRAESMNGIIPPRNGS